jgi:hypothetical protein
MMNISLPSSLNKKANQYSVRFITVFKMQIKETEVVRRSSTPIIPALRRLKREGGKFEPSLRA